MPTDHDCTTNDTTPKKKLGMINLFLWWRTSSNSRRNIMMREWSEIKKILKDTDLSVDEYLKMK
ncbi:MAG: hypothetical protein SYNGOMJ08_00764 [Candidatus Syntrophoarchaeum sp. GoM_oil]|nr:MAG: hypothetical protein SYNGOMJ08_00764 [Candidatus Syntrophoarchaeum sp. GoM_oil]